METLKWKIFRLHTCLYAHTRIFWSREGRVSQITWFDFSDWLNDVIISLRDHGRRDCWHRQTENQSLWFCWAFSSFLFFSRLILSESLLYFTGKQSRRFLLAKPSSVFRILFSLFIYLSWLTFFLYAQVRVFAMWHLVHAFLLRLRTKGKNCWIVYSECSMPYNLLTPPGWDANLSQGYPRN